MTQRAVPVPRQSVLGRTLNLVDYWWTVYRRTWKGSVVSSFVSPLLYVLALGVLLGGFVEAGPETLEGADSYLTFVVPGLLAAQSMLLAFSEGTYPVMSGLRWHKTFFSMVATPLGPAEVVLSNLGFMVFRVLTTSAVFCLVMVPFGVFETAPGALAAFAVQPLVMLAFGAPLLAYSCALKDEGGYTVVYRLLMMPLFLFSGAFFPVGNLDGPLQLAARATPLWHGVDLTRMLSQGTWDTGSALLHLGYLSALAAVGAWAGLVLLRRRVHR